MLDESDGLLSVDQLQTLLDFADQLWNNGDLEAASEHYTSIQRHIEVIVRSTQHKVTWDACVLGVVIGCFVPKARFLGACVGAGIGWAISQNLVIAKLQDTPYRVIYNHALSGVLLCRQNAHKDHVY